MGWEKRARGGRYYTRSRRVNGKTIREYIGTGEMAEIVARLDAVDQKNRCFQAEADRKLQNYLDNEDRTVGELCATVEAIVSGLLVVSGYHRHKRGEWRRKRERKETEQD